MNTSLAQNNINGTKVFSYIRLCFPSFRILDPNKKNVFSPSLDCLTATLTNVPSKIQTETTSILLLKKISTIQVLQNFKSQNKIKNKPLKRIKNSLINYINYDNNRSELPASHLPMTKI